MLILFLVLLGAALVSGLLVWVLVNLPNGISPIMPTLSTYSNPEEERRIKRKKARQELADRYRRCKCQIKKQ